MDCLRPVLLKNRAFRAFALGLKNLHMPSLFRLAQRQNHKAGQSS